MVERLDIKKSLYSRLDSIIKSECVVTSNTSSIPITVLMEDMSVAFHQRVAITHYVNPVRYMRLLELVSGKETSKKARGEKRKDKKKEAQFCY